MAGTEQVAPLTRMWRSVYQKAAEVAEARTQELLKYHVYVYPHGAGGGGGLVELGRAVATAGQVTLRVPASGALPTGYSGLWLSATGRTDAASGVRDVYLFFNDDTTAPPYLYSQLTGNPGTGAVAVGMAAASALRLGFAPAANPAEPLAVFGASGTVPLHAGAGFPKTVQVLATYLSTAAAGPQVWTVTGLYAPDPAGPITSVHLRCLTSGWQAGSALIVYGCPDPA